MLVCIYFSVCCYFSVKKNPENIYQKCFMKNHCVCKIFALDYRGRRRLTNWLTDCLNSGCMLFYCKCLCVLLTNCLTFRWALSFFPVILYTLLLILVVWLFCLILVYSYLVAAAANRGRLIHYYMDVAVVLYLMLLSLFLLPSRVYVFFFSFFFLKAVVMNLSVLG